MNKIFTFYPHCYLRCTDNEILVYDTLNQKHIYVKGFLLSDIEKENLKKGFLKNTDTYKDFINKCIAKNLGYFIDYDKKIPFMYDRVLNIVTSLSKEKKALGYNLHSYTNLLLKEVTILLRNSRANLLNEEWLQIGYPLYNQDTIDLEYILNQLSSFPSIENIILSGEINESLLSYILAYAKERNIHITHRIFFDCIENINSYQFIDKYENLSIELLVENSTVIEQLGSLIKDKFYIKAIIRSIDEIAKFSHFDNIIYLPVLSGLRDNTELLTQMILTEEDILQSSKSLKDCIISDYINTNTYGNVVIDYKGSVYCFGKKIASIRETDLPSIINSWIDSNSCAWYYTRKMKDTCMNCALQNLCPPISIYEDMGFYKCPCRL